jgi:hypothetical protein
MRHVLVLAMLLSTPCVAQEAEPPIQAQLNKVASALQAGDTHLNVAAIQEAKALDDLTTDKFEIVKQVAIFAAGPGEQQPLVALAIMDLLDYPPSIVIRVLAPYLNDENRKLRSFVRDWFQNHDNAGADDPLKPVNYEDYVNYVRGNPNPPEAFVDYIFERSPGRAFIVFYRASQRGKAISAIEAEAKKVRAAQQEAGVAPPPVAAKGPDEILLAELVIRHAVGLKKYPEQFQRVLPEAKEQLSKLSQRDESWVKRYVEEIKKRHPELTP